MPKLGLNVDHVATVRQARGGMEPDPVTAAAIGELAGAEGITIHLREDRRHIQDRDLELLRATVKTNLHLEMAATPEMRRIALETLPHMVCLVPEKRAELTTEGGLDLVGREAELRAYLDPLHEAGVHSSLFIDADPRQIESAATLGAEYVEIHTGHYADAVTDKERHTELEKILRGISQARGHGLKVNLGHGLDYVNILAFAEVPGIHEYSIGHCIVARAVLMCMSEAVGRMVGIVRTFVQ